MVGERAEEIIEHVTEMGFDAKNLGESDGHDKRPVVRDGDTMGVGARGPGSFFIRERSIVVEVERRGPQKPATLG